MKLKKLNNLEKCYTRICMYHNLSVTLNGYHKYVEFDSIQDVLHVFGIKIIRFYDDNDLITSYRIIDSERDFVIDEVKLSY